MTDNDETPAYHTLPTALWDIARERTMNKKTVIITSLAIGYTELRRFEGGTLYRPDGYATASGFVSWPDGMRSTVDSIPLNADEQAELDGLLNRIAERVRERF